jgi:alpha,alpha-trehalase
VRKLKIVSSLLLLCLTVAPAPSAEPQADRLRGIQRYIAGSWNTLTRSMSRCDSVVDPKRTEAPVLYLPANYPMPDSVRKMQTECGVVVKPLPFVIRGPGQNGVQNISPPGLLFLEHEYVVPGGRFNEM